MELCVKSVPKGGIIATCIPFIRLINRSLCCPVAWILELRSIRCLLKTRPLLRVVWYVAFTLYIHRSWTPENMSVGPRLISTGSLYALLIDYSLVLFRSLHYYRSGLIILTGKYSKML